MNGQRFVDPLGIAPGPGGVAHGGVGPGPYGQPGNRAATAALVCGIIAMLIAWIPLVVVAGFVLAILAVVFGARGLASSRESGVGRGRAVTGLITGVVALGLAIVGVILTVSVFREVIAFVEPGPRLVEDVECVLDRDEATVTGNLTNLGDRERDYVVFVSVGSSTRYVEIDGVGPRETVDWRVRVDAVRSAAGSSTTGPSCDADVFVSGPFPFGIETDPVRN